MKIVNVTKWLPTRARKKPITTIVLHGTAGASATSSINWLRFKGLSYHYIIERDGTVYKCAPVSRVAFHAGVSTGPDGANVNDYSLGICFANMENGVDPLTEEQLTSCNVLLRTILASEPSIKWITRHKDIAPKRKTDPVKVSAAMLKNMAGKFGRLSAWVNSV